jgi:hypothetical protein
MWKVPAVLNGPIETGLPVTCTLLTVGASGSFLSSWFPLTHEPFDRLWNDVTEGIICNFAPFATFTHDSLNVVARVCTTPVAQLDAPPPLLLVLVLVGVVLPPLDVAVPGRTQAASKILPSAKTARSKPNIRSFFLYIALLPLELTVLLVLLFSQLTNLRAQRK